MPQAILSKLKNVFGWIDKGMYTHGPFSPGNLNFPNFIIIGAPKSGTWWLASRIEKHPEVCLARGKESGEVKYFNKFFHKPLSHYSSYFEESNGRIIGEKSPNYCRISRSRVGLIKKLMPDVRLILILRNPIERAWSEALMALVRDPGKSFADIPPEKIYRKLEGVKLYYSVVIERWLEFFDQNQIRVCLYDDIRYDPEKLLRGVFQHIRVNADINYQALNMGEIVNAGTGIEIPGEYRAHLVDMYADDIRKSRELWGEPIQPWLDAISA